MQADRHNKNTDRAIACAVSVSFWIAFTILLCRHVLGQILERNAQRVHYADNVVQGRLDLVVFPLAYSRLRGADFVRKLLLTHAALLAQIFKILSEAFHAMIVAGLAARQGKYTVISIAL